MDTMELSYTQIDRVQYRQSWLSLWHFEFHVISKLTPNFWKHKIIDRLAILTFRRAFNLVFMLSLGSSLVLLYRKIEIDKTIKQLVNIPPQITTLQQAKTW